LTTITVAVPAPLSPTAVLQAVAAAGPHHHHPATITLPSVPAPQESLKWKFEQSKDVAKNSGGALVRYILYFIHSSTVIKTITIQKGTCFFKVLF